VSKYNPEGLAFPKRYKDGTYGILRINGMLHLASTDAPWCWIYCTMHLAPNRTGAYEWQVTYLRDSLSEVDCDECKALLVRTHLVLGDDE